MASIGSLVAELSANTASFQKDMGKAAAILNSHAAGMNKTVAGIERTISRAGAAFVTAFSAGAILRASKSVLDMGEQFANLSEKTGVSVEKLSEFVHGAKLSDVSIEELSGGLRKLATSMAEASTNGAGQMAETFRALGISVTDSNGKLRDTASVFEDLAAKFAGAKDGPEKAAIAVQLLGKSGDSLIPLLNGLAQTSEEARRLGLVMSKDAADNAKLFNDEMTRLSTQLQVTVLPAVIAVSKAVRAIMGSEDIDILMGKRAKAAQEYSQLIEAGMSRNSARIVLLLQQIDELDAKIIESNKRIAGSASNAPKTTLPTVADPGQVRQQVRQYQSLLQELQKATKQAQMAITTDDAAAAQMRMDISVDEFRFKIKQQASLVDASKEVNAELIKLQDAFKDYVLAAQEEMKFKSRSQLDAMLADWRNTSKQLKEAAADWLFDFSNKLTDLVLTGKADFKDLAQSIIRDLVRIQIQAQLANIFGSLFGGSTGGAVAGARAYGGPVTGGSTYLVGEKGPEMFVPNVSGTIVPNNQMGGTNVTVVLNISTGVADTVRAEMMTLAPVIEERSKQGVLAAIERGGRYSQAVGRRS